MAQWWRKSFYPDIWTMASVEFYIRDYEKDGKLRVDEVKIICRFTVKRGQRFEIRTDRKVQPKHWSFEAKKVKSTYRGHIELNEYLDDYRRNLLNLYARKLPFEQFKTLAQGGSASIEKKTLFIALEKFLTQYKAEKDLKTWQKYHVMSERLKTFISSHDYDLPTLDFNFYDSFKSFLFDIPNPNYKGFSLVASADDPNTFDVIPTSDGLPIGLFDDTVYKYIVNLKTFLEWCKDRNYEVNPSYERWKIIERTYEPITLTEYELEKLESFRFTPENVMPHCRFNVKATKINDVVKALDIARDYLALECRTGQRISDLKRFDLKDYFDFKWIFYPKKGNRLASRQQTVYFKGFTEPALSILQKHNWKMPTVSEQKINDNIKTACKIIGINSPIEIFRWAQNKRIRFTGPKYEFLSTHIGRKTFVTIGLHSHAPKLVKQMAGIKSWKTLQRYEGDMDSKAVEQSLESKALMVKSK